jgi:hypothetical protein
VKGYGIIALLAVAGAANATVITQWNFNGDSTTSVPGGVNSPTPNIGAGTASLLGSVTATFASGAASGGSSDPAGGAPPNYAWNTTTYAAQGTENGQRGVQFNVSTVGWLDIVVSFDTRHSNTASRFLRFDYTTDGTNWVLGSAGAGTVFIGDAGDTWFNQRTVNLTSVSGVNNNANFAFRVVAIFEPGTGEYRASGLTGTYGPTGTLRYDMVTVSGAPVPEPATLAALGLGAAAVARRRRSRK